MRYRIESRVTIQAPATVVWQTVQDVARRTEWDARVRRVSLLTALPIGKGARTELVYGMLGLPFRVRIELVAWCPGRKSAVRGEVLATRDELAGSWQFTENADGSTTWLSTIVITSHGPFARLRQWVSGPITSYLTTRSQRNLKRLVEREHPVAARVPASRAA